MTRRCEASGAGMAASHPLPQSAGFASNVSRDVGFHPPSLFMAGGTRPTSVGGNFWLGFGELGLSGFCFDRRFILQL